MYGLVGLDWGLMFGIGTPVLGIFVRVTVVYLSLFLLLRFLHKRQSGALELTDLLVVVLIADAAQNAIGSDYISVADDLLLVATILFWSHALNWLGYRVPALQRLVHPPALPLVKDGEMLLRNMRREPLTAGELLSQLREQRIKDVS